MQDLKKSITPFSIIDIGSFSIRLVVYDSLSIASRTLFNEKVVCNLGSIVSLKKKIDKNSMNFLMGILKRFISITKSIKSDDPIIIATAAVRLAENRDEFINLVLKNFGIKISLLTEKKEGLLSAFGTIYSHKNVNGIVGDLGGGSIELTEVRKNGDIVFLESLKLGHTFLENVGKAYSSDVQNYIKKSLQKVKKKEIEKLYAVGGSFRVIARLYMFLKKSNLKIIQDYVVSSDDIVKTIKNRLFEKGKINFDILTKVTKSRRNSLPYALNVFEELMIFFDLKKVYFSSSGIREGYIYDLVKKRIENKNTFLFQVQRLSNLTMNKPMAESLYKWIKVSMDQHFNKNILLSACWISNIAWDVHPEHRRLYAMERILWYPFYGITRQERIELAIIMYFRHSNGIKDKSAEKYFDTLDLNVRMRCKYIGQCLRLAHHITGGLSKKNLDLCSLKLKEKTLVLYVKDDNGIFYGQSIPRGLKNAANALGLEESEIKFI